MSVRSTTAASEGEEEEAEGEKRRWSFASTRAPQGCETVSRGLESREERDERESEELEVEELEEDVEEDEDERDEEGVTRGAFLLAYDGF
jgi:hypothetical protein